MSSAENERLVKEERVANTSQEPDPSLGELHAKKKDGAGCCHYGERPWLTVSSV